MQVARERGARAPSGLIRSENSGHTERSHRDGGYADPSATTRSRPSEVFVNQRRSPTIRRRRLGAELRRYREQAGITIDVAADRIGCSKSKVSRIETGHNSATPKDVQ